MSKSQKSIFFVDDLHLTTLRESSCSSPLEAIYQAGVEACVTDPSRTIQLRVHNIQFLASISPSTVERFSSKFLSQFVPVLIPDLSSQSVSSIFKSKVSKWLSQSMKGKMEEELLSEVEEVSLVLRPQHLYI